MAYDPRMGHPGTEEGSALDALGLVLYGFHAERGGLPLDFVGPGLGALLGRDLPDDLAAVAGIWAEAIHVDDRAREAAYMARLAAGEAADVVFRAVLPDGSIRWLWDRGRPYVRADGSTAVIATIGAVSGDVARALAAADDGVPSSAPLSATVYHAVRAGDQLITLRIGEDWEETTGIETEPERALDALGAAVHPSDAEMFRERARLIHAGLPFDGAFRIVDRRGAVRWLSERATPRVRGGRAEVDGVIVDVSRQNALFDDVRTLDARLRHLLETLDAHVYTLVVSSDTGHVRAEFLGPRLDVIYGETPAPSIDIDALWTASVHPDDRRALEGRWERLRAGHPTSVAYRVRGLDGVERWIRDDARPRTGEDGHLRVDGVASRLDQEAQLRDERRGRHAVRVLAELEDVVYEYELTSDGWRVTFASDGIVRVLGGVPPADRDLRDVIVERIVPDDLPSYYRQAEVLASGAPSEAEFRVIGLDGRVRRVLTRAHPLRGAGGSLRAVGVASVVDEAPAAENVAPDLTARQLQVLARLAAGLSTEAIAKDLVISTATVRNHVTAILAELRVHSRLEAVAEARRLMLL